jgi:hypothetical protein
MGLTTTEIEALKNVQATMESIREEHARRRKQRGKAVYTALQTETKWEQD